MIHVSWLNLEGGVFAYDLFGHPSDGKRNPLIQRESRKGIALEIRAETKRENKGTIGVNGKPYPEEEKGTYCFCP